MPCYWIASNFWPCQPLWCNGPLLDNGQNWPICRTVEGINFATSLYCAGGYSLPVGFSTHPHREHHVGARVDHFGYAGSWRTGSPGPAHWEATKSHSSLLISLG